MHVNIVTIMFLVAQLYKCLSRSGLPLTLRSFPTRRSSDLLQQLNGLETLVIIMVANKYAFLIMTSVDRKSGSAGMPRPISYAVFCPKKKKKNYMDDESNRHS